MPDINSLLEISKNKFKKSSYRPWNYMEEREKEEVKFNDLVNDNKTKLLKEENNDSIQDTNLIASNIEKNNASEIAIIKTSKTQVKQETTNNDSIFYSIFRLSGHQKTIFAFILEKCLSNDSLSSGAVSGEKLVSITNTSLRMVNTSIQRLVEKNLVFRENGKRGRGGFYSFRISQEVKSSAIEHRKFIIVDNKELLRLVENQSEIYSHASVDNKNLTNSILPEAWEDIDIEPLQAIGFSKNHLIQLYKQGDVEARSIQDSIDHFFYDLKYNKKSENITKSSPIGYFMGILKRSGVYAAPDNYESPKTMALRELLERKRVDKEKYETMVKELINIAFEEWQTKLSAEEKEKLIPDDVKKHGLSAAKQASLKLYFTKNIWKEKEKEFLL